MSATPPSEQPKPPTGAPAIPTAGALLVATTPAIPASDPRAEAALWLPLRGRTLAGWSLDALLEAPHMASIALITLPTRKRTASALAAGHSAICPIASGPGWRAALAAGMAALPVEVEWVVVHDATRPLITPAAIAAGMAVALGGAGVALAGEPGVDTLKRAVAGRVVETLDRARLWRLEPPLVIRRSLLARALAARDEAGASESASLAEIALAAGVRVAIYPPGAPNPAITSPADWPVAEALLAARRT